MTIESRFVLPDPRPTARDVIEPLAFMIASAVMHLLSLAALALS